MAYGTWFGLKPYIKFTSPFLKVYHADKTLKKLRQWFNMNVTVAVEEISQSLRGGELNML